MQVFVAIYDHRHGTDTRVFAKEEGAEAWRQKIAAQWWEVELGFGRKRPEDLKELADTYFEEVERKEEEFFNIEEKEVEGL